MPINMTMYLYKNEDVNLKLFGRGKIAWTGRIKNDK
jgi:hypothetical protein